MKKHKQLQIRFPKIHPTIQLFSALGLFMISVILSRQAPMTDWEISVFQTINNWPAFLRPFILVFTQLGTIYMLAIILIIFAWKRQYHVVLRMLLTCTLAYQISGFAKDIWGRARPVEILAVVANLDYFVRGPGFPSGHVALATAMALTVGQYLPRKFQWVTPLWIIGVIISRIYLGVHAPLDVIGGFAIGWFCYALFRHVRLQDIVFGQRRPHKAKA